MPLIDYSKYSPEELLHVKASIDSERAPENYRNLMLEMERRHDEIEAHLNSAHSMSLEKRLRWIKIVGWLQIVCAVWLAALFLRGAGWAAVPIALFNGVSGVLAVRGNGFGLMATAINQLLQVCSFKVGSIAYLYRGFGELSISFTTSGDIGFNASINPSFHVSWVATGDGALAVDLLAVFFLCVVVAHLVRIRRDES